MRGRIFARKPTSRWKASAPSSRSVACAQVPIQSSSSATVALLEERRRRLARRRNQAWSLDEAHAAGVLDRCAGGGVHTHRDARDGLGEAPMVRTVDPVTHAREQQLGCRWTRELDGTSEAQRYEPVPLAP